MGVVVYFDNVRGQAWCKNCEAVSKVAEWWKSATSVFQVRCPKCDADWDSFWPIVKERKNSRPL